MERRFDMWDQDIKKNANEALDNIKGLMKSIKNEISKQLNEQETDSQGLRKILCDDLDQDTMENIYNNLCTYYNNNTSLRSHFESMWKKIHESQGSPVGQSKNKQDIVVSAIVAATGAKKYSGVGKGIIPVLRLSFKNAKDLCEDILHLENTQNKKSKDKIAKAKTAKEGNKKPKDSIAEAKDAKKDVGNKMKEINEKLKKKTYTTSKDLDDELSKMKDELFQLYEPLSTYYAYNPCLWSHFRPLWDSLHKWVAKDKKADLKNNKPLAVGVVRLAILSATGSKKYSKLTKGLLPALRLTFKKAENYCADLLGENLKRALKNTPIKAEIEDFPEAGKLLPED